jgi:prepilin signal peptidase PulO-like enzyme (type II secretory pathway)
MLTIFLIFLFVLWASFGSFGSVLLHRLNWTITWQKIKWILYGRSQCTNCKHQLWILDLFPIFSRLLLRWKCRYCKIKFTSTYLWLEIFVGIWFLLAFIFSYSYLWYYNFFDVLFLKYLLYFSFLNWALILMIFGDILFFELNLYIWLFAVFWAIFFQFFGVIWDFRYAWISAIFFFAVFYWIYLFGKFYVKFRFGYKDTEWFWWWDVMASLLIWLNIPFILSYNNLLFSELWNILLFYIIISCLLGIIFYIFSFLINKWKQGSSIPFLPAMIVAFFIILFFSKFILSLFII